MACESAPALLLDAAGLLFPTTSMNSPSPTRRRPPQISLSFMMLMMIIFAVMSAGLFYASRVPAVQEEIASVLGNRTGDSQDVGRAAHIVFIMFTFTSPLLLAGVLSTAVAALRWIERRK